MKELLLFLGLCNYYHRFILGYAKIAAPLKDLFRGKPSAIQFSDVLVQAFLEPKNLLVYAPVYKVRDPELPVRVLSDASKMVVGAILELLHGSNWHPIECISKSLYDTENKYCAIERKMLGSILDS